MVRRCNKVGIRIYVDLIINHMTLYANEGGTGGSKADVGKRDYPEVPYSVLDFNHPCTITDYSNQANVRNCELSGLPDLNQGKEWVRDRIVDLMNKLISLGVAGFRLDASKHMWPENIAAILNRLNHLNTSHGFEENKKPFIAQEVIDLGNDNIARNQYSHLGTVTEFKHSAEIGRVFRKYNSFKFMWNWGEGWNFLPSHLALVFVDNHDNQRGHGGGGSDVLNHKLSYNYKMAVAFMLAFPYGIPRVMSSFDFNDPNQGPPQDAEGHLISPSINADGTCGNGWVCEHRWRQIYNMIEFRNVVAGTGVNDFWTNDFYQMAFCRGDKGFILFNLESYDVDRKFQTCLKPGVYCDVISGEKRGDECTGKSVTVEDYGWGHIHFPQTSPDGVLAIHANVS